MKNLAPLSCLLALTAFSGTPIAQAGTGPNDELTAGLWVGGYGSSGGERPRWEHVRCTLEVDGEEVRGQLRSARGSEDLVGGIADGQLELVTQRDGFDVFFSGELREGVLVGECIDGDTTLELQLVRVDNDEAGDDACSGIYRSEGEDGGARIYIRPGRNLMAYRDDATGTVRALYRIGEDVYVAGERYSIPHPRAFELRFERDARGRVTGFTRTGPNGSTRAVRVSPYTREGFRFESFDGTAIQGELLRPATAGPHPAIVWVHGSGRAGHRSSGAWAMYFVDKGYAVLTVDKRGVGSSEGTYEMPDGGHDNVPHMRRRSRDVRAAVAALAALDDIEGSRIGLVGASQAGWVIPQAAEHGGVAFTIILSGGATQISYEGVFSRLAAESDSRADALSIEECLERLRKHRARDYDFREHFAALPGPGLWLYGDRDRSNPSQLCVELIEAVADEHAKDFTIARFPEGNHGLWQCRLGGSAEYPTLTHMAPGIDSTLVGWMRAKGLLADAP